MPQTLKWLAFKSQQKKSLAKMWGKGVFTTASVLYFSAICCSLPVCFAADSVPAGTQNSIAVNVTSTSSPCTLPKTFKWTSTGPLATPQNGSLSMKDFSCVVYNNQFTVYFSTVNSSGTVGRGHDDLHYID